MVPDRSSIYFWDSSHYWYMVWTEYMYPSPVQRQLKITAFVEWSTAKSCELLMLCRHLLRGLMVCDVMTDCYPV